MAPSLKTVFALLLLATTARSLKLQQGGPSPIGKVVSMMNDMLAKAKQEKQEEKVRFAAFESFCKSTTEQKNEAIDKGAAGVESLEAEIAQAQADAEGLAKEIAETNDNIDDWEAEAEKAVELRKKSHAQYKKTHAETVDSIESTRAALEQLDKGNSAVGQSLLQLSQQIDPKLKVAMLQSEADFADTETAAPEAAAFEGSSGAIIGMVEGLEDKFKDEKTELEKREMNEANGHNLKVNDLQGQIKQGRMEVQMKTSSRTQLEQDKANAKGDLADTSNVLAEDKKFRTDLTAECELKTTDFQKRQVMRQEEIEAIEKAIEIMTSDEVTGGAQHALLVQRPASSLLEVRSTLQSNQRKGTAASFLEKRARATKSQVLAFIALKASSDPFAKVTKMVKDMINKLMTEANEEAEQKGFCDTEMGTNKMTRDRKTEEAASLSAEIEGLSADVMKLSQEGSELQAAIGEVDAQIAKATSDRDADKQKNQQTIEDTEAAQGATAQAIQVLKEYYEKAANQKDLPEAEGPISYDPRALAILSKASGGASSSLAQVAQKVPGAPEMESGQYTGMENGGIMGMLEIVESDFAKVLAETRSSEAQSAGEYDKFMNDCAQEKAVNNADLKHKQDKRTERESDLVEARSGLKGVQRELQAANDYFEKLKPDCVKEVQSYDDKVAARKQEIESLQEAMKILSGDAI